MERIKESSVELEQRLPTGTDHEATARIGPGPGSGHCRSQFRGRSEFSTTRPVGADKVGVTELTGRVVTILLPPSPQITAGKAAEYRRPPGVGPFALQGVKDLFDSVTHKKNVSGTRTNVSGEREDLGSFGIARARRPRFSPSRLPLTPVLVPLTRFSTA